MLGVIEGLEKQKSDFENEPKDLDDYYKLHEFKKRDIDISSVSEDKELMKMI